MLVRMLNYSINFFLIYFPFFALTLSKSLMLPEAMKLLYVKKIFILIQKRFLSFTFKDAGQFISVPSDSNRSIICAKACTNLFHRKLYHNFPFIFVWVFFFGVVYSNVLLYIYIYIYKIVFMLIINISSFIYVQHYTSMMVLYIRYIWLFSIFIKLSGYAGENPGLKPKSCQSFSICHLNVNSVSPHNFSKVFLLRAQIAIHKFETICISERFLNSDPAFDDDNLMI